MAGQGGPPRPRVSYAAAARPPSDADERELILVAVHGEVSKLDAVHVLQYLRLQKHYDANGKVEGFHSEANFNPSDPRRRFRMTFSSKGARDTFVDLFRAPLTDAQKSSLPDNLKHNAGPRLLVEWKSATGQLRCLIDIIEPRKRERILVVKVATVKPLVDDSVVAKKFEQYGTVDRIQRLHFRDFPLVENGVRLVFLKNLVADTFIPPPCSSPANASPSDTKANGRLPPAPTARRKATSDESAPSPARPATLGAKTPNVAAPALQQRQRARTALRRKTRTSSLVSSRSTSTKKTCSTMPLKKKRKPNLALTSPHPSQSRPRISPSLPSPTPTFPPSVKRLLPTSKRCVANARTGRSS